VNLLQNCMTSDAVTINPADIFSSEFVSSQTLPSSDYIDPETIDPEILAEQLVHAAEVLGELAGTEVAQRILLKAPLLSLAQLERIKGVLELCEEARTNMFVFADIMLGTGDGD
jgi:hypothetical protein